MSDDQLLAFLEQAQRRREEDARRYSQLDPDECQLCDANGPDMRSLFIDCFYAVDEAVPEAIDVGNLGLDTKHGYYLRICKSCRGRLLRHLGEWADGCRALRGLPKDDDGDLLERDPARNIPVRENGATVWLTREEWEARYPGREPVVPRLDPPA